MLSATRVIGHKEYGNTPPGGWVGRKVDPVYDMNWRRGRVANFRPRAAAPTPQQEDDMPNMDEFLNTPAYTGGPTISTVLKELDVRTRAVDVRGPDGKATGKKIGLPDLLAWFDNNMAAIRAAAADVTDPQQFADTLRPLLLEVAQTAAASARAGADSGDAARIADRVVDEMVTRMARPVADQS